MFVDGRMGARFGSVFFVPRTDEDRIAAYRASWPADGVGHQEPCTAKATVFCAYGLAAYITAGLTCWFRDEAVPFEVSADFSNFIAFPSGPAMSLKAA